MPKLSIKLPDELKRKLDARLAGGEKGDVSEYVGDLIRQDLRRLSPDALEHALINGLRSGRATRMTQKDWSAIREEVAQRTRPRRQRKAS